MSFVRWASWALAGTLMVVTPSDAAPRHDILEFSDLNGWEDDDHQAAFDVFLNTCGDIRDPEWAALCSFGKTKPNAKSFFEMFFKPVLIGGDEPALFTGYYEPELKGSRTKTGPYQYPLYKLPPEVKTGTQWHSRKEIEENELLSDRGLAIAYVDNPVDVFFLQVQGSGRVDLAEGGSLRVGYAGKNGHEYKSIGQELVRRGIYKAHQVSASVIRRWVKRNPIEGRKLLHHNASYVFFREVSEVPADKGPLGAMNRSITPHRSIAIDPAFTRLGAPVWIEKAGKNPMQRLMIAQDTGSAIKGPQRADIYFGTGAKAGLEAGQIKDSGRVVVLMPTQTAYALADGI